MHTIRLVAGAAVLASVSSAQTVWSMGAPWPDLAAVIAQAAPGDIVRLNGLTFASFNMTKGLTILGPGVISAAANPTTTLAIPPTQRAHVVDVDFTAHRVLATGTVTFEDCSFTGGVPYSLDTNGTILVQRCTFLWMLAPASGMRVQGGLCWITDSQLVGGHIFNSSIATTALNVVSGEVCVSNSTLTGGNGDLVTLQGLPGVPALVAVGGSVSITDWSLTGGSSPTWPWPTPGAVALSAGTNAVGYARSTFVGGAGAPAGGQWVGPVQHVPLLISMRIAQPFRLGLSTQLIATAGGTGTSAQPLGMMAALELTPAAHPIVIGTFLGATPLIPLLVAFAPPGGLVVHPVPVPNQPNLLGTTVYAQAFQLSFSFLRVSPMVGGVVY
jgi:hypothetical protein